MTVTGARRRLPVEPMISMELHSFSNQENEIGIASVAMAIWQQAEGALRCVSFVSITAPLVRATEEDFARYRRFVLEAAHTLGNAWPIPEATNSSEGAKIGDGSMAL
jgi:hypothetical protein